MVEIKRCDWAENSELEKIIMTMNGGDLCMTQHKLFKM